ncbi:DUF533 domain-containing protein [Azospirillum sp. SYSU D00513]|uniref:tellurite resistance TerB family protein n=1 Tax=Azospirillum sp. SYSU D00513 TaxID=2812561 RepID=UPI001A978AB7|nr:DUF533 domain-containing protein [Azospirillum sp. SYSU D00513]
MADLTGILGTMLATGMAGRSRRGPAFSASPFGMGGGLGGLGGLGGMGGGGGFGGMGAGGMPAMGRQGGGMDFRKVAGIGALGYLAYKAFQERQQNAGGQQGGTGSGSGSGGGLFGGIFGGGQSGGQGGQRTGSGGGLGDRLSGMLRPAQPDAPDVNALPEATMEDQTALLLIRAMIAAANADGEITAEERQRILSKLDEAGAGPEEHRVVEHELRNPLSTDALVREARDADMGEQVYLASLLAMEPDTEAERSYLQYLAARLNLTPQQVQALGQAA